MLRLAAPSLVVAAPTLCLLVRNWRKRWWIWPGMLDEELHLPKEVHAKIARPAKRRTWPTV